MATLRPSKTFLGGLPFSVCLQKVGSSTLFYHSQDLMHRIKTYASLFAIHCLTEPNYGIPWLKDRSPRRPSRHTRSVIRDGIVKTERSSHKTKEHV